MAIQAAYTLNPNEIYNTIANLIINIECFADNIGKHQTLVEKAKNDSGLFGDKKIFMSTDVLKSYDWLNDAEASNLLALDRPADPAVQALTIDNFRQIRLTLDNYMTKRAFADEGSFAQFTGVMLGWMNETKRVFEGTMYNQYIGCTKTSVGKQAQEVDVAGARGKATSEEEANRLEAEAIAQHLANLFVEMGDYSREFNDYGYLRSYDKENIKVIWNSEWIAKLRRVDLPSIFHKDGLIEKFEEEMLPARYFGDVVAEAVAAGDNDGSYSSVVEKDYEVAGQPKPVHVFPGDLIPAGVAIAAGEGYVVNPNVICKVVVKLPPLLSSISVGTTFFNSRSLTENHYTTFGFSTLAYLKNYPFITISAKSE